MNLLMYLPLCGLIFLVGKGNAIEFGTNWSGRGPHIPGRSLREPHKPIVALSLYIMILP